MEKPSVSELQPVSKEHSDTVCKQEYCVMLYTLKLIDSPKVEMDRMNEAGTLIVCVNNRMFLWSFYGLGNIFMWNYLLSLLLPLFFVLYTSFYFDDSSKDFR